MKCVILLNSSWNIINFRESLIRCLVKENLEVVVIAPGNENRSKIESFGCQYLSVKNLARKGTNPIRDLSLIIELAKILKKEQVDLLLSFTIKPNIYGSIAASLVGVKTICTVTGLGYSFLTKSKINLVVKRLYKYAFSKANLVVFQNPDDLNLFKQEFLVNENKSRLIYGSGIDTEKFSPSSIKYENEGVNFLFVGRLLFDKGIAELLNGMEAVKEKCINVMLHVLGEIDVDNPASVSSEFLEKFKSNPSIKFHGYHDNVKSFIEKADVLILPSYREGIPRVMLEALSMEKPIITTDVPGCREVISNNKNGILIPARSSVAIEEAIIKMASFSNNTREQMGKEGRKIALAKFSTSIINRNYVELINKLITDEY